MEEGLSEEAKQRYTDTILLPAEQLQGNQDVQARHTGQCKACFWSPVTHA